MKLWLCSAAITWKRLLRDRAVLAVLLLLPLCTGLLCRIPASGLALTGVEAGILCNPEDPLAVRVRENLPEHRMVTFRDFRPEEEAEMLRLIRTGELECGYLLEDALQEAVSGRGMEAGVTLVTSPRTVADAVISELVYAAVLAAAAPELTAGMILEVFQDHDPDVVAEWVEAAFARYALAPEQFMGQSGEDAGEEAPGHPGDLYLRPVHGVIALFLLLLGLSAAPRLLEDRSPGIRARLGRRGTFLFYSGIWSALTLLGLLAGALALLTAGVIWPAGLGPPHLEAGALLLYAMTVAALTVLASLLADTADSLLGGGIPLLVAVVLMGGILFDWGEIHPLPAAVSRLFPTWRYVDAAAFGGAGSMAWLLTLFLILTAGAALRLERELRRGA